MYQKPRVVRLGTFRELTQVGFFGVGDGCTIVGPGITATGNNFQTKCGRS